MLKLIHILVATPNIKALLNSKTDDAVCLSYQTSNGKIYDRVYSTAWNDNHNVLSIPRLELMQIPGRTLIAVNGQYRGDEFATWKTDTTDPIGLFSVDTHKFAVALAQDQLQDAQRYGEIPKLYYIAAWRVCSFQERIDFVPEMFKDAFERQISIKFSMEIENSYKKDEYIKPLSELDDSEKRFIERNEDLSSYYKVL